MMIQPKSCESLPDTFLNSTVYCHENCENHCFNETLFSHQLSMATHPLAAMKRTWQYAEYFTRKHFHSLSFFAPGIQTFFFLLLLYMSVLLWFSLHSRKCLFKNGGRSSCAYQLFLSWSLQPLHRRQKQLSFWVTDGEGRLQRIVKRRLNHWKQN